MSLLGRGSVTLLLILPNRLSVESLLIASDYELPSLDLAYEI
jgi:hypothetical protein